MTKTIRRVLLTQGRVAIVDAEDYPKVVNISWHYEHGYARSDAKHGKVYLHRVINGTPRGLFTDHKNGDTLDNRKSNLRSATRAQNSYNAKNSKSAISKYKGVSRAEAPGRWRARIMVNYKEISLGVFNTEYEAYRSYLEAAKYYQGEFARII